MSIEHYAVQAVRAIAPANPRQVKPLIYVPVRLKSIFSLILFPLVSDAPDLTPAFYRSVLHLLENICWIGVSKFSNGNDPRDRAHEKG